MMIVFNDRSRIDGKRTGCNADNGIGSCAGHVIPVSVEGDIRQRQALARRDCNQIPRKTQPAKDNRIRIKTDVPMR